ncbi:carboxypeptidase regulatory-like domain-containing protein [Halostella pelagica]|uniref:carboxypeptidase regulatory-like domain-containing protein n=1 Tax=Halostella pelagica TaxID=2583824 RepID=UPI0010820A6F|nr:carboxypeptidase-like regulatory domain-containing protein [Halostella pelagica]
MNRSAVLVALLLITSALGATAPLAGADSDESTPSATADGGTPDLVTLELSVVDDDGTPVGRADVNVTYDGGYNETTTVSNGRALVDVPRGVSPSIYIEHDDYVRNFPVEPQSLESNTEIEVTVHPRANATIDVSDDSGAVDGARVSLKKDGDLRTVERGRTDADGTYRTDGIEAGEYTVRVVREGYLKDEVEFTADGETTVSAELESARTNVDVTVRDGHFNNSTPVGDVSITVSNDGDEVTTVHTDTRNGEAATRLGVNTEYTVTLEHPEYETVERELEIDEQDDVAVTYNITRTPGISIEPAQDSVDVGGTVRIEVTDEYGQPIGDAVVYRGDEEVGQTDGNGVLSVPITAAGEFEITAESDGLTADAVTVEGVGEATETATPDTSGDGEETDSDGGGLPGFTVWVTVIALAATLVAFRRRD